MALLTLSNLVILRKTVKHVFLLTLTDKRAEYRIARVFTSGYLVFSRDIREKNECALD